MHRENYDGFKIVGCNGRLQTPAIVLRYLEPPSYIPAKGITHSRCPASSKA